MFYGGAFDVAVIWGLPPCKLSSPSSAYPQLLLPPPFLRKPLPLLLGVYSVRLLTRTTSLQRGPLEALIAPVVAPNPGLMTVGGMGSNS